jgi:hypothetical protein
VGGSRPDCHAGNGTGGRASEADWPFGRRIRGLPPLDRSKSQDIEFINVAQKLMMPGGWSEGPMDQSAKEAMDFALEQLHTTGKLEWIISVKQQVVSGMNYEIAFELDNKTRWNALVYRNLAGEFTLTKLSKRP